MPYFLQVSFARSHDHKGDYDKKNRYNAGRIEGNRLTQEQVQDVVLQGGTFPNRERDEQEVRNYYRALDYVDALITGRGELTQAQVKTLHGLVMTGQEQPVESYSSPPMDLRTRPMYRNRNSCNLTQEVAL